MSPSLIFLLPSILLIILFSFIALPLGLVLMAKLFLGLLLFYHLVAFVVSINSISSAHSPLRQGVPQGSVLGPLYSYSIRLLLVLLSLIRLSVIIYLLMTLNCSFPSEHRNSPPIFYTSKIQLILSLNGCLLIFPLSINQSKMSFFLVVYLLNYLKSLILLF